MATKLERAKQKAATAAVDAEQKSSTVSRKAPSPPPGFETTPFSTMTRPPMAATMQPAPQTAMSSKEVCYLQVRT